LSAGSPAAEFERALAVAFRHLNRRERTVHELRAHLLARKIAEPLADAVLARLIEQGYLDDARFARLFTQDKRALEQWGAERIRTQLIAHGVDRELARAAVEANAPQDELDRARAVLRRRFPHGVRGQRERERALGILLRKGYTYELAREAIRANAGA
jgi:regulatory protein